MNKMTPSTKARIAAQARARWARVRAAKGPAETNSSQEATEVTEAQTVSVEVLPAPVKSASHADLKCANDAHLKGGDDTLTAKQLNKLFADAQTGMRKIVALGLFAWEIKERQLKHGEFGAWLAQHCPKLATADSVTGKPRASRALSGYMDLTKSVLENVGFDTIEKYLDEAEKFSGVKSLKHGGFLLMADKKVPDSVKPLREKICELVDGKTQRSLFSEFKQAEEDAEGNAKPKKGRVKGCAGTTAEQRAAAEEAVQAAALEELGISAVEHADWLMLMADAKGAGTLDASIRSRLQEACEVMLGFLKRLESAQGGAQ
jgi:hypothetical protein